jgi:hypothetical protein
MIEKSIGSETLPAMAFITRSISLGKAFFRLFNLRRVYPAQPCGPAVAVICGERHRANLF